MNIKEEKKKVNINFKQLLTGCPDNKYIGFFLMPTIVLWVVSFAITSVMYALSSDINKIFFDMMFINLSIFACIGVALSLISLVALDDWVSYGKFIWFRVVGFNLLLLIGSSTIQNNIGMEKIIEPAKSLIFVKTDNSRCLYQVKITTENMKYVLCESGNSAYDSSKENPNFIVNVIGVKKYGKIIPESTEIIEKETIIK